MSILTLSPEARQRIFGRRPAPPEPPQPPDPPPEPTDAELSALWGVHGQQHLIDAARGGNARGELADFAAVQAFVVGLVRSWGNADPAAGWIVMPQPGDTGLDSPRPYGRTPKPSWWGAPPCADRNYRPWLCPGVSAVQETCFRLRAVELGEALLAGFAKGGYTPERAETTLANLSSDANDLMTRLCFGLGDTITPKEAQQIMDNITVDAFEFSRHWTDDGPDAYEEEMAFGRQLQADLLAASETVGALPAQGDGQAIGGLVVSVMEAAPAPEATPPEPPAVLATPMTEARTRDLECYRDAVNRELARRGGDADIEGVPLDMIASMPIDPSKILLVTDGVRYLSRGGCLLFVGPSGVGKSTATTQAFIFWALGRPAFGIAPARPLKIVVVQAENDSGDLTAMTRALFDGAGLTAAERAIVGQQVRLISHNSTCGPAFLAYLEQVVEKHHPDLIVIDPLMAYAGGDLTKTEVVASFCRNGLNPIATRYGVGLVVVHHTPKLTNQNSNASARRNYGAFDWQYAAAGSADLANWARAMLVVEPLSGDVIALRAAKRWPGWLDPGGAQQYVRYFRREREPGMIFWHDAAPGDVAAARSEKSDGPSEQSLAEHRTSALGLVEKEPLPVAAFEAAFMRKTGLGRQRARDVRAELEHDGTLAMSRREPARDGRKYIGTLETIRELEAKWATPKLPGV